MKPGDKLWLVTNYQGDREITVGKIGTKWAATDNRRWRLNLDTMQVFDGAYHVGMAYESEQAYRDQQALIDAWEEFRAQVRLAVGVPPGMTLESIAHATAWLGVGT
jgi:hypothetical protein